MRGACATLAKGISGIQYGTKEIPMSTDEIAAARNAALDWFRAVTEAIGPAMEDRTSKLASSPAVLAAIGAMGHTLMSIPDPALRITEAEKRAAALKLVNWERDKVWEGIAGKFTPKGVFSVGGAKETGYAIYSALADPSDPGYARIRSAVSGIAA